MAAGGARLRMPAEWAAHERTLMAWPCRAELWGATLEAAKGEYAAAANAIVAFEPVTMACADPAAEAEARAALDGAVETLVMPLDDSWLRDSGPIVVLGDDGERAGVDFVFNSWGEKFLPFDRDARAARLLLEHLGIERIASDLVLEGGAIAVDGEGTLITTEQCLLHPSRNPSLDREEIEGELSARLGIDCVVWLGKGLVEDQDTDGHVDLIAAFVAPGRALIQTVADESNPNWLNCQENVTRLEAAGIEPIVLDLLPYAEVDGEVVVASYMNFYVCNGAAIVPLAGVDPEMDDRAIAAIGAALPDHEVVGVPGLTLAYGGGGVHCITQQVPAPR